MQTEAPHQAPSPSAASAAMCTEQAALAAMDAVFYAGRASRHGSGLPHEVQVLGFRAKSHSHYAGTASDDVADLAFNVADLAFNSAARSNSASWRDAMEHLGESLADTLASLREAEAAVVKYANAVSEHHCAVARLTADESVDAATYARSKFTEAVDTWKLLLPAGAIPVYA